MSAISVNNVSFKYKTQPVLVNIYARIPEKKIYGLLGPSGAGKTTLLKLILGRVKLQSGTVTVLGGETGSNNRLIGYMPQDCALCLQLTVKQTLLYFANIYHLSKKKYKERIKELDSILGLPEGNQLVSQLSGGQQRCVSLALAFLHSPKLVILDEPTVGTDPELGDKIWKYLHSCCNEGLSVLLVTHYTEEATFAHNVGFMRDGRLIEEGVPQLLLDKFKETSLENVFLRLCKYQENHTIEDKSDSHIIQNYNYAEEEEKYSSDLILTDFSILWILLILIRRNISKYFQYKLIFLVIFSPAFQTLLMCLIYTKDSVAIKASVFNGDHEFINGQQYSKQLLKSIKQIDLYYVKPIEFESKQLAIDAVIRGEATAAIIFPYNFTSTLDDRIFNSEDVEIETLKDSNLRIYIDNSNFIYANFLVDSITQSVWNLISDILVENGKNRIPPPIKVVEIVHAPDSKLSDFLLPGYMIAFIYLSQVTISSLLLIQERNDGLFDRAIVAGAGHQLMFMSHFLTGCLMSFINVILMFMIAYLWFGITNYGSYILVVFLVMTQAANAIATGLLISSLSSESFVAFFASLFISLSQLFTSGAIFPNENINPNVRKILYFSPIAMPTESLRNTVLKGWDLTYFYVFHGFAMNIVSGLIFIVIAIRVFKKTT